MADTEKLVTFTVNDRKLAAPAGTLLIEACKTANVEVPSFCYYPNLSLQAACRMCLVEIEKMPKLQTACTVLVAEGMVVQTESEPVRKARKSALEFILTNHPLDCPVCDAGGECELQDMTFRYGAAESRFVEIKQHRDEQQWSPVVYFDRPRCILCYRCVRVCGEGMDVWALGVGNRGVSSVIIPNKQDHLECEECGMCIDICPVGALTSGAYRYKTRPWEMKHVANVCTFCGDGCKTTLGIRNDEIVRGDNRDKSGINGDFLCIKGRYGFDFTQHKDRLRQPLVRVDGVLKPVSWAFALQTVARRFQETQAAGRPIGVLGSTRTVNEENYQLQKFARRVLQTNHIDHHRTADFPALYDALAGKHSPVPLAASEDLKTAKAVFLIGSDPTNEHPLLAWNLRWGYRLNKTRLYLLNSQPIKLRRQAFRAAIVPAGSEGQAIRFLNGGGAVNATLSQTAGPDDKRWPQTPASRPEATQETLGDFRERLQQESDVIIVFGAELRGDDIHELVKFGSSLPGTTRYIALADNANSHGAADMGLYPDLLPGYTPVADVAARQRFESLWGGAIPSAPGMDAGDILGTASKGELGALYVVGSNPFRHHPVDPAALRTTFVVVQDLFLTETATQADVVLPALSAYEKQGTLTNTCGEVQLQKGGALFEGAKTDLEILHTLAGLLGHKWAAPDADEIFTEIRGNVKGYNVSLVQVLTGSSALSMSVNGPVPHQHALTQIQPNRDSLFTAGSLGRYSTALNAILEKRLRAEKV
ncbi:MAG: NADH-quinone oxidoreductase subunit NuoG [Terriglobales bacterium]